jgi:Tol biopolymer transport system component
MRRTLALGVVAVVAALGAARGGDARPHGPTGDRLIDCYCYDLFRITPSGKERRLLSRGGSRDLFDVSADRTQILFSHVVGSLSRSTITGGQSRVLPTVGEVRRARFSPDGTMIAYIAGPGDGGCGHYALHVMGAGGVNDRALQGTACGGLFVAWSPDSQRVAFARLPTGKAASSELVVANVQGTLTRVLARTPSIQDATWSPTGERIAYVAGTSRPMLHVIRADGTHDLAIAPGTAPTWAPDGRKLAYSWNRPSGGHQAIAVIARDGTHNHLDDPRAIDPYGQGVGWSPDSKTVVYRRDVTARCQCISALWTAHPDGSHRRHLLTGVKNEEFGPLYWARDGMRIVYTRYVQFGE